VLTKDEKEILQKAATILKRELAERKEVAIAGFGKFYVTALKTQDFKGNRIFVKAARFKPWEGLKKMVNPARVKSGGNGESTSLFDF
jgi:nucleoid DNA-binding protein